SRSPGCRRSRLSAPRQCIERRAAWRRLIGPGTATLAARIHGHERGRAMELWGGETRKAVDNFPVSGEPIPAAVVHWLGPIKAAAARVNADLGLLDADVSARIAEAADSVAAGTYDDQFPIDVFQTGSGTSSNM